MKFFSYVILLITSLTFSVSAQIASPKTNETLLRVETEGGKVFELKTADLAKLPRRDVKTKTHDGKETNFSGVDLREVLKLAGVKFGDEGKKANLISYLMVEAADKYRAVFAMIELEPDFTDKIILLADSSEEKPLSKDDGKLRLVVPDEKKQARWVRQVIKLSVTSINAKVVSNALMNDLDEEDLIREIVFKKILERWRAPDASLKAFYLSVEDKDPSENLLKKFVGKYKVPIRKFSDSIIFAPDGDTVLNKNTKEQGVLFSISKIDWKNKNEVVVNAGSYIGNMGGDGCDYVLTKENGSWKIISADKCYVS